MTIGHDLEQRLDRWMQEDATLPDDLREVLAKLPETPQRRHRWSFTFAELAWRTRTMFSATRVAATVAIFALGASVALISVPLGRSTAPAPGQPAAEEPERPVVVSGTAADIRLVDMCDEVLDSDPPMLTGNTSVSEPEMDDPRVSGTYLLVQNGQNRGGAGPMWGTMRVENEDGAWEGPVSGYWTDSDTHFSGCLAGEASYEGLTYCLRTAADVYALKVQVDGLIYEGSAPPVE